MAPSSASSGHFNKSITGAKTLVCKGLGAKESRPLYKALKITVHLPLSSLSFVLFVILKMDEHWHKVLVALVFFMAIRHVIAVVIILQQLALHQHYGAMMMMVAVMVGGSAARRGARNVWMVDQRTNFMERQLLGSYSTFQPRTSEEPSILKPKNNNNNNHTREQQSNEPKNVLR